MSGLKVHSDLKTFPIGRSAPRDHLVRRAQLDRLDCKDQEVTLVILACLDNQAIQPANKDLPDHLDRPVEMEIPASLDLQVV